MKIILPKNHVEVGPGSPWQNWPLFFLAGPVLGGGDWQRKMLSLLYKRNEGCLAVVPCRYGDNDSIRNEHVTLSKAGVYERQTDWERHYLELAAQKGCIIFWLGCESKINPRNDGQPYARDTYGELGEWRWQLKINPKLNLVIGAERDFPGLSVIERNYKNVLGDDFTIHSTMEEVVKIAVQKSYR